jgi:methylenetetrahydrofolate reductase (NADPH)
LYARCISPPACSSTTTNGGCITVPEEVRASMAGAQDPVAEGIAGAREMPALGRQWFAGACLMPPFDHYEVLEDIL